MIVGGIRRELENSKRESSLARLSPGRLAIFWRYLLVARGTSRAYLHMYVENMWHLHIVVVAAPPSSCSPLGTGTNKVNDRRLRNDFRRFLAIVDRRLFTQTHDAPRRRCYGAMVVGIGTIGIVLPALVHARTYLIDV